MSKTRISITVRILPDGSTHTLHGREAWALQELMKAGMRGCTPIDTPGPRWSHYVFQLRRMGFAVETIHEKHAGPFPGTHARYVLRSDVGIVEPVGKAA
jgi:hypothetical protein